LDWGIGPEMVEFSFWAFKSDPTINKQLLANTFELIPEMKTQLSITSGRANLPFKMG
jgi:hypothetical protein